MARLSYTMCEMLRRIDKAGPEGHRDWGGRTTDALRARDLVRWEAEPGDPLCRRVRWFLTDAGRAAIA